MAQHRRVTTGLRKLHCIERLGQRTNLVDLHQDRVGRSRLDAFAQELHVRHEQIVAHKLDLAAQFFSQRFPVFPVTLRASVLDADNRVLATQLDVEIH